MSVFSDNRFCVQASNGFIDLTPAITGIVFTDQQNYAAVDLINDDPVRYPAQYATETEGGMNISGLIYEDGNAGDSFVALDRTLQFMRLNKELGFAYPVCQMQIQSRNLVFPNGVVQIASESVGSRADGLTDWRFGHVLPQTYNSDQQSSIAAWGQPNEGAWVAIAVLKRGGLTVLEARYTISGTTYRLAADLEGGQVNPQLKIGQLKDGSNVAAAAAGSWRLRTTGSRTNAEIYVMVLR